MTGTILFTTLLLCPLAACSLSADEHLGEAEQGVEEFGDVRLLNSFERWHGGSLDQATGSADVGTGCSPGYVRVDPPTISHSGNGWCAFDQWVNHDNPYDCMARITLHNGGGFSGGVCNIVIYEQSEFSERTIAIKTSAGFTWTASAGGGQQGTTTPLVPLRTNATASQLGPQERFHFEWRDTNRTTFALKTNNGYVSATSGGGVTGANDGTSPLHTDAWWTGPWEHFTLRIDNAKQTATLRTLNGDYVSANSSLGNGFGCLGGICPLRTDAPSVGPWETFSWLPLQP